MQERAYEKAGASNTCSSSRHPHRANRALMFVALDKLQNQGLKQAIIVVPERSIGASFGDEPLSTYGFWATGRSDQVEPVQCAMQRQRQQVKSLGAFLERRRQVSGLHLDRLPASLSMPIAWTPSTTA